MKIIIAVLVVIGVCAGVFAKYSKDSNVEQVTSVVAAVENDSKSISIKWNSVKNCTGYNLYESTNGTEFRKSPLSTVRTQPLIFSAMPKRRKNMIFT